MTKKKAFIISVNDFMEHEYTIYNKVIFLGETVALIDSHDNWESCVYDIAMQGLSLSELTTAFLSKPDLILFWAETNQSKMIYRLARLVKKILPDCKVLVYGVATIFIPQYFSRQPFDAVHISGDRESAISNYLMYLDDTLNEDQLTGLVLVDSNSKTTVCKQGTWLNESDWPVPNLVKLPLDDYLEFQRNKRGVADCRLGLSITATKGCFLKCNFCGCSEEEGIIDRTRNPETIIDWIEENGNYINSTIHLYSPNILSSPKWVEKFSHTYHQRNASFSWQGVTMTNTVTEYAVALASKAGCKKLSIGIEHISLKRKKPIKSSLDELKMAADACNKYGVELVGLLMLGYPKQTIEDVRYILSVLSELNIKRYRFTGYTPLHKLRLLSVDELDSLFIEDYDRRTFYPDKDLSIAPYDFFNILITNGNCLKV